ncbi:MAG TPA: oxygenase MpaB family protein, partial [Gammaproteobacteria bacterium]|nr:oxygenase MpaB family protein [Gammaproteobacteria bacterium]
DPERDHLRIVYFDTFHEFPFDTTRSLEFALFRTFAAPRVSTLLDQTGEFGQRPQKRYDDTDLILSELIEHGYDSERGRAAIRRMNRLHGRFPIANEDYLYVLSTFIFEPVRWNARFGWRRMVEQERLAMFYYWREVGRRMNIKDIPADYAAFEGYNAEYERAHFRYAETNRRVAASTRDMFLGWFLPRSLRRLGEPAVYAMMDEPLLDAFGFPKPSPGMRRLVEGALRLRARLIRLLPERKRPRLRTGPRRPTYPQGYRVEELGPE